MTHVTVRNGLTLAYTIAFLNASLALLIAFGVTLTDTQQATIVAFVNAAVLLGARVLHLPERTTTGTVQVEHVPVLVETPTPPPVPPSVTTS
jgi:hypothetical protein